MVAMEAEARRMYWKSTGKRSDCRLQRLALGVVEMGLALQIAKGEGRERFVAETDLRRLESGDGTRGPSRLTRSW